MEPNPYEAPQISDAPLDKQPTDWWMVAMTTIRVVVVIVIILVWIAMLLPA
jgi:hypothetical protein